MDDIKILDTVERYIRGEMKPDERLQFEQLRKSNAEIDQLVVEHTLFLQQLNHFGERKTFRSSLNDVHTDLTEQGKIDSMRLKGKAKVIYLWRRYKRVTAIAASIAGITALGISALVWAFAPKAPVSGYEQLKTDVSGLKNQATKDRNELRNELNIIKNKLTTKDKTLNYTPGGTSFVIDPRGYLVTNFHVIQGAKNVAVENGGQAYKAKVVFTNSKNDIAILKIEDEDFKPFSSIPYSISKAPGKLAESIFTLGYPKEDIVYAQGYLSSKTGYHSDTLAFQIEIAANPGNSGSPILNKNGEVIGVLNGRQKNAEGFTFAVPGKYIYNALAELKKDTAYQKLKLPAKSSISGLERTAQAEKVEGYVFMVKVN
jgi:S1-C subfamily serine protease